MDYSIKVLVDIYGNLLKLRNYPNLKELDIWCNSFDEELKNLLLGLEVLKIISNNFNQELDKLPEDLKRLYIRKEYLESYSLEELLDMIPLGCELYVDGKKIDL